VSDTVSDTQYEAHRQQDPTHRVTVTASGTISIRHDCIKHTQYQADIAELVVRGRNGARAGRER
jgi:hypothetical protein